jgi:hypothetical protein
MDKEEYYKRIEKINNRFKTDRVSADEEYQLVCQRNYLSTKYIEHLEQQCKKQKEVIDKVMNILKDNFVYDYVRSCDTTDGVGYDEIDTEHFTYRVYEILKEVSE